MLVFLLFPIPKQTFGQWKLNLWTFSTIHVSKILIMFVLMNYFQLSFWRTPKLLDRPNYDSKGENNKRIRSWGTLPNSQHFRGRGVCWSLGMGTRMNDKQINYSHRPVQIKQQVG